MPVEVQDLSTLNPAAVTALELSYIQMIGELNPGVNLQVGVVRLLVLHLKATLDTATQENITLLEQSGSLTNIIANPALQDTATVNRCIGNFRLVRNPGAQAQGSITIVLNTLAPVVIVAGSQFTINGVVFTSNLSYAARTSSMLVIGPNDVLITSLGSGQYGFTINATALLVGAAGNVPFGSAATPTVAIPYFTSAYASVDFTGGADQETNQQLVMALQGGLAAQAWMNRVTIEAMILNQAQFANIGPMSIIGFGDPEMLRDAHSIWPGHLGGRSDVYALTAPLYQTLTPTLTATLISKAGPVGTWQITIGRNDLPGYYKITGVLLPNEPLTDAGFPLASEVRSFDLTGLPFTVDIVSFVEAVYSRYQTATITFVDTVTNVTSTPLFSTAPYVVVALAMPLLAPIQDYLMTRQIRPPMGDVLTKGPVPCFTIASFTLNMSPTAPTVNTAAVATLVANAVDALGFVGQLSGSVIDQVLHANIPGLISVTSMVLAGTIRNPDATTVALGPGTLLTIPNTPAKMTTPNTTVFFLKASDVTITVVIT